MSDVSWLRPSRLLGEIRGDARYHWPALVVACLLGLVVTSLHWSGLVLGGALVGILATTLKRAILSGVGFGVLVVAVWVVSLALPGQFGKVVAMNEITALPIAIALGLSILGSLVRGTLS